MCLNSRRENLSNVCRDEHRYNDTRLVTSGGRSVAEYDETTCTPGGHQMACGNNRSRSQCDVTQREIDPLSAVTMRRPVCGKWLNK